jgi:hypothetical protein
MNDVTLPPHGKPPASEGRLPCRWCGAPTLGATLSQYGARCFECYEAYCNAPPTHLALTAEQRRAALKRSRELGREWTE